MPTYNFNGFVESDLLNSTTGSSISEGDHFTMPSVTTTTFSIWDNDSSLSGDTNNNEQANDSYGQTATIKVNGVTTTSGKQAYVECYHILKDENGKTYYLIEIEVENHDAPGQGDDYFTFWGDTPPAGAQLTVIDTNNTCGVSYCNLGTDIPELPTIPGSIGGRLTWDADGNDNEWNAQTGTWDQGIAGKTVKLIDANGNVVATTTTNSYGEYKFSNVAVGDYKVQFPGQTGYQFSAKDVGSDDGSDSDANANGLTDVYTIGSGQNIWNVDAGLKNLLSDGNEASTVREDAGQVALTNVLLNTVDPEAGQPFVVAVSSGNGNPMSGNVGQQVTGSNGGVFTINADGSITFDTNGAFDALNFGESTTTSITYCVKDAGGKVVESVYTVTVNGIEPPIVVEIDAVDDAISVGETQDVGTSEDGALTLNVLDNDGPNAGATVQGVSFGGAVHAVGSAFTVTTAGGRTGQVTLNADGSLVWDGGDNFVELNEGESDSFQIQYKVSASAADMAKHNLLFVLDISNSTVGGGGGSENVFSGQNVADLNGDGLSNTVLDAEINAVQAAVQKLLDQAARGEIDLAKIDIGIVTFSGVAQGYTTVNAATLGTFAADSAALNAALTSIVRGGWTNYEAGLQHAEDWFAGQWGDGATNSMYFLSDGRPIIGSDANGYIYQSLANYGDELNTIANTYGASIHAIGIGANSDLAYLNQLDNTGGAVQVLDTSTLAAEVAGSVIVTAEANATVTVTINGENEVVPVSIDARDDVFRIGEAEGISGANLITGSFAGADGDDFLLGDLSDEAAITDAASAGVRLVDVNVGTGYDAAGMASGFVDGGAIGSSFTVTTAGGREGVVTVDADGNLSFALTGAAGDPAFNSGDVDQVQLEYTIERVVTAASTESQVLDFNGLARGTFVNSQYEGVTITGARTNGVGGNQAMIFDAANPTGGDTDLRQVAQGGVLIISEDGDSSDPDDNAGGGTFTFTFAEPRTIESLSFLDTEEPTPLMRFYDAAGNLITSMNGPVTADSAISVDFPVNVANVSRMEVVLIGSGAIDDLTLTRDIPEVTISDTAVVTITIDGEGTVVTDLVPLAVENSYTTDENSIVTGNLISDDSGAGVDEGGDGGVEALSVVSINVAGTDYAISAGGSVVVENVVSSGGYTGTLTVSSNGSMSFSPIGFDAMNAGDAAETVDFTYTIRDADDDESTADVSIQVTGVSDTLILTGVVNGPAASAPAQTITVLIDYTLEARTMQFGLLDNLDLNGDLSAGTAVDQALAAVLELARDLPPSQIITLIPFGATVQGVVQVTAGAIADAFVTVAGVHLPVPGQPNPFAALGQVGGVFTDSYAENIDLDGALGAASALLDSDASTPDTVYVIASNEDFPDFVGDTAADLKTKADVEAVLFARAGLTFDAQSALGVFDQIDSDGSASVVSDNLAPFVGRVASTDISAIVTAPAASAAAAPDPFFASVQSIDLTVGGQTVNGVSFGAGANASQVSVGGVTFTDVAPNAQVDVLVTLNDGSSQLFENVQDADLTNDTFDFDLNYI